MGLNIQNFYNSLRILNSNLLMRFKIVLIILKLFWIIQIIFYKKNLFSKIQFNLLRLKVKFNIILKIWVHIFDFYSLFYYDIDKIFLNLLPLNLKLDRQTFRSEYLTKMLIFIFDLLIFIFF